jgi:hypothetical protein
MTIHSKDFRVQPGEKVELRKWPTTVKPFYESKKHYRELLVEHVQKLSALQGLFYASNRYALLVIFRQWTRPARTAPSGTSCPE